MIALGDSMNDLLQLAVEAHGGIRRWEAVESLEVQVEVSGKLLEIKGFTKPLVTLALVSTKIPRTAFYPYALNGRRGIFTPEKVWIETATGEAVNTRDDPRDSFAGHVRASPWDQLHRLYFLGYAMWNYLSVPFLLMAQGVEVEETFPHAEDSETWRVLQARFPSSIPTHCELQKFYFDSAGMLKRVDYVTDVAGGVAAHYCYDPKNTAGLIFPTRRRVVKRGLTGPIVSGDTAVFLDYKSVKVNFEAGYVDVGPDKGTS